jgi:tetratricopeptide (TPR) repeat protein
MTCPPYFRFPVICNKLLLLVPLSLPTLSSCTTVSETFYNPPPPTTAAESVTREKIRARGVSSQFEWAVQNYEAGNYDRAISQFRSLMARGSTVPSFELIPFYLGMSLFQKGDYHDAIPYLESFLKSATERREGQEARIALLSIFERLGRWESVLGMAAETDKLSLFQDHRAFLKLVWARALQEKGEARGARAVLKDASQYLDGYGAGKSRGPSLDGDLWGRFHFTSLLVEISRCASTSPKEIGSGNSRRRLYEPWLDATVDCYRQAVDKLVQDLLRRESPWSEAAVLRLDGSLEALGQKLQGYLKQEVGRLERRRALEGLSRRQLYRLLGKLDESEKSLKNQTIIERPLSPLRKRIDLLLVSLSATS